MRAASLILAGLASVIGLVFPFLLGTQATGLNQSILTVVMLGIAGAFIYGAGFSFRNQFMTWLLGPFVTWPVMLGGLGLLMMLR